MNNPLPPPALPQSSLDPTIGSTEKFRRAVPKSQNRPDLKKVLKERCLKRAREQRQNIMNKRRSTPSPLGNPLSRENLFSPIAGGGGANRGGGGSDANGNVASAKELLDEELRMEGAAGAGGLKRRIDLMAEEEWGEDQDQDQAEPMSQSQSQQSFEDDQWGNDEWGDNFETVSEEEYAQLLEEIEKEMREDEEIMLREYEEGFVGAEYEYVEQLGGEFEGGGKNSVLCPICESCDLVQTSADVILCKKKDCLRIDLINEGIDLKYLKENLANIFFQHAAGCPEKLKVVKDDQFGIVVLMAQCDACGEEYCVL